MQNDQKYYIIIKEPKRKEGSTDVSYSGSADNNDKTNANMLARRRAFTGFGMLKRLFTKLKDSELNEIAKQGTATTGGKTNVPAYGKGQKVCRFCEFTIKTCYSIYELIYICQRC